MQLFFIYLPTCLVRSLCVRIFSYIGFYNVAFFCSNCCLTYGAVITVHVYKFILRFPPNVVAIVEIFSFVRPMKMFCDCTTYDCLVTTEAYFFIKR